MRTELVGQQFGRLTVLQHSHQVENHHHWHCGCVCGNLKTINGNSLKRGLTQSCGCLQRERAKGRPPKHTHSLRGGKPTKAYYTWQSMISRCYYPSNHSYKNYAFRGTTVCDRWRHSFENFYADMGDPPSGTTLERIDNEGNYTPENCKWATPLEQAQNRRTTRRITYQGTTQSIAAWERTLGFTKDTLLGRIRHGWDVERAFTTPVQPGHRR